jgi:hypothetical protein
MKIGFWSDIYVIYIFILLCLCILIVRLCTCIFIVPAVTFRLPWLRFFRAFSSVVRQMPWYNPQRRDTAYTFPKWLCCSIYCLFCIILCIVCVQMCTVLLPPRGYPIAVNKYSVIQKDGLNFVRLISWIIHGMWITYITFERRSPTFSNFAARALA